MAGSPASIFPHILPPVQQFDPTTVSPVTAPAPSSTPPTPPIPPSVPANGGSSGSGLQVDTSSLQQVAGNFGQLVDPVKQAYSKVQSMAPVAAGGFPQGSAIEASISGSKGLAPGLATTLNNIQGALMHFQHVLDLTAQNYANNEAANSTSASQLAAANTALQTNVAALGTAEQALG